MNTKKLWIAFSLFVVTVFSQTSFAQGLNWEGQTGALLTPFAYTASAPTGKFGKPEVAFHYLNSGPVIGNDYQLSITEGICKHFEIGYTGSFSSLGSSAAFPVGATTSGATTTYTPASSLFSNGFNAFHGKFTVVSENAAKTKWIPAIAVGAIGRFGAQRLTYYATKNTVGSTNNNGDLYIVATKTVTQVKGLPFVLSLGEKVTNASLFGIAGNAGSGTASAFTTLPAPFGGNSQQMWQGRTFGAVAFVVKGPAKSALIFGSEAVEQPHYIQGLTKLASIPTSESYFVRVVPHLEGSPLAIDLGVAHIGGKIVNVPGTVVDLQANARVGMGVSYHF